MLKIREAIVVEGRYDKAALASFLDAVIIQTDGFGLFHDGERMALLRRLAEERGIIVFTDPDGAGFVIRNYIKSAIDPAYVKHAYIPDIPGRERRKATASKEGKLGVEGVGPEIILHALRRAGATIEEEESKTPDARIGKADLYALGLSGAADSAALRRALREKLRLPERMTTNAMLDVLNALYDREQLQALVAALRDNDA